MNEITEKWEKTGLLQDLDEFNKNECAKSLEKSVWCLIVGKDGFVKEIDEIYCNGGGGFFSGTFLPIVRRLYNENDGLQEKAPSVDINWLIKDYYDYCKDNHELFKDLNSYISMDGEAEFVCLYVEKLKGRI